MSFLFILIIILGLTLNYLVIKRMDWNSSPYSGYRHFQFVLAGFAAGCWSMALLKVLAGSSVTMWVVVPLLALLTAFIATLVCMPRVCLYKRLCELVGAFKGLK